MEQRMSNHTQTKHRGTTILAAAYFLFTAARAFAADPVPATAPAPILMGAEGGLYRMDPQTGKAERLWKGGEVRKIVKAASGWYLLSSQGIIFSADFSDFQERNAGLTVKTLKVLKGGEKRFESEVQELKDLEIDPEQENVMAACSKDEVFLSRDSGASWSKFATPVSLISGLKAVGVFSKPRLTLIVSHPIKGLFAIYPDERKPAWFPYSEGLDLLPSTTMTDEIADIKAVRSGDSTIVYASGSFRPRIYARDSGGKSFRTVYARQAEFGMVESLQPLKEGIAFVSEDSVFMLPVQPASQLTPMISPATPSLPSAWAEANTIVTQAGVSLGTEPLCLSFTPSSASARYAGGSVSLSELWLLKRRYATPYADRMKSLNGIYLQTGFVNTKLDFYRKLMRERGINMLTIDMKDDFGRLRFEPKTESVKAMSRTVSPIDVEKFVATMKEDGVYLVARIVVFKDQVAYKYSGGKYAVYDSKLKKAWQGYNLEEKPAAAIALASPAPGASPPALAAASPTASPQKEYVQDPIEEYWVDPYCEDIWRYNVDIAKELIERGFDEVQFDYIRFPTDGDNLGDASYRFRDPGMDKESAIMSFLSYARASIDAPISVDIYGANGYYRTGVRTGQDVEMFRHYVDAICPMYYPSHFEQDFFAMKPEVERPYRIYYFGTMRNTYIGRYRVVVRPWVQAFSLNVRFDKKYYGPDYVLREIKGVRDSANSGLTFWNNSGRYDDLPMAPGPASLESVKAAEAKTPNLLD
jgi:hypothetical protein